ncbi:hypothetical protein [Legionella parisiensis]|uniref:hypothetical protein n=1 Tax=Legionella parisiensis TaxID=45071 RepID=UPI00138F3F07|nr:hypothetical protein [Legionella parisiensis]
MFRNLGCWWLDVEWPIRTLQPPYHLFERGIEEKILPFTQKQGIITLAYVSVCRGL